MKTFWLGSFLGLCAAGTLLAAAGPSKAVVNFDNWQKFTDIKDSYQPTDRGEQGILDQLRESITREAKHLVPDGDTLNMTFQDIHLAGDFEPWRGAQWDDIRVVKDIYPPHFEFTWTVTDAAGKVLRQGKEDITDTAFQMRITIDRGDPLHYEKDILNDWMHEAVRGLKAA